MPSFQQLLKGAAERIAKRQSELSELQKAAAKRIELEGAGNSMFANPEVAPEDFKLYHGSPYKFDEFDFESNMLKGEGAMAYGPGGYMTGHEPLGRQYATQLFSRKGGAGSHKGIREALNSDNKSAAEYLRAITLHHLAPEMDKLGGNPFFTTSRLNPHSKSFQELSNAGVAMKNPDITYPGSNYVFRGEPKNFFGERTISTEDFDEYRRAAELAGLPIESIKTVIGRGGVSPLEAVRQGRELRAALSASPGLIRPKLREKFEVDMGAALGPDEILKPWQKANLFNEQRYGKDPNGYVNRVFGEPSGFNARRRNLNSTARVIEGRPGGDGYTASMVPNSMIHLRDPGNHVAFARRLYSAPIDASFADMLPYDYPISTMTPEKLGALAQLAEKRSFLSNMRPDMTGQEFLRHLQSSGAAYKSIDQVRALKEAGIPATFYLRGGQRSAIPDKINPEDFNFVIHDQSKLGKPDIEEFSGGGAV